jgi:hypothetical protein
VGWAPDGRIATFASEFSELISLETGDRVRLPVLRKPGRRTARRFAFVAVRLLGRHGDVLRSTGVAIHLIRLSDGKDVVLDIEDQTGASHAELEPTGLFYAWNEPHTRRPGWLAFVPWMDVVVAFDRAG